MQVADQSALAIRKKIRELIPKDMIVAEHTKWAHFYRYKPRDELYISVTQPLNIISSPHLKKWAANQATEYIAKFVDRGAPITPEVLKRATLVHDETFKDAGDIGTKGHEVIEDYLNEWIEKRERPLDITPFIEAYIKKKDIESDPRLYAIAYSAQRFFAEHPEITPIWSELLVAVPSVKVGGTLDFLCLIDNKLAVIDFKTSNSIDKDTYAMQVAAYSKGFTSLTGMKPKIHWILRLDKTKAAYELRVIPSVTKAFAGYRKTLALSRWLTDSSGKVLIKKAAEKAITI